MPIPGSRAGSLIDPGMLTQVKGLLFPSICTFYSRVITPQTTGQDKVSFVVMAHVNLPCRRVPIILLRPETQVKEGDITVIASRFHLSLPVYLTDVLQDYQVTVDGVAHRITGVEWDGQDFSTRFALTDVVPFGG